ncbi:MAG TPA: hypothetical protein VGC64_04520 [Pyrinomonadaceae bacterium]|jgi:hypothetical protein
MRRVAALVLVILLSISILLPLVNSSAHRTNRPSMSRRHRGHRHSRAWWRRYRSRRQQQRAALARRRSLVSQREHNNNVAAPDIERPVLSSVALPVGNRANDSRGGASASASTAASALLAPERRSTTPVVMNGQTQFRLYAENGQVVGVASLSAVTANRVNVELLNSRMQRRQLAGVPFADLRHQVIEKMIAGNGWVVNDLEREINGHRVFVVVAQTASSADGRTPAEAWNFYFTEIDGRIYSLAAHAPLDATAQMDAESAKVLATLPTSNRSVLAERGNR